MACFEAVNKNVVKIQENPLTALEARELLDNFDPTIHCHVDCLQDLHCKGGEVYYFFFMILIRKKTTLLMIIVGLMMVIVNRYQLITLL